MNLNLNPNQKPNMELIKLQQENERLKFQLDVLIEGIFNIDRTTQCDMQISTFYHDNFKMPITKKNYKHVLDLCLKFGIELEKCKEIVDLQDDTIIEYYFGMCIRTILDSFNSIWSSEDIGKSKPMICSYLYNKGICFQNWRLRKDIISSIQEISQENQVTFDNYCNNIKNLLNSMLGEKILYWDRNIFFIIKPFINMPYLY